MLLGRQQELRVACRVHIAKHRRARGKLRRRQEIRVEVVRADRSVVGGRAALEVADGLAIVE